MTISNWSLVLLAALIITAPLPLLYPLWCILNQVKQVMSWVSEVKLPQVDGFDDFEVKHILAGAAELEYPDKTLKHFKGRRKSFSRRSMENWVKRDRFERFRDAMIEQGYLAKGEGKESNRWTERGRALLMQVKAGRFGPLVNVLHQPDLIIPDQLRGDEIVQYTVEVL